MAKGIGLIGNFSGKVGNTVGYQLSASNNGQTQGVRVYQPNVKNPKTAAQAEQRAKLAPINATYRALKSIIDRGQEGVAYGNNSRLAWLKKAFMATKMPWYIKGAVVNMPVICQISKGSLAGVEFTATEDGLDIICQGVTGSSQVATIGAVSTLLKAGYSSLKDGDQVTIILIGSGPSGITTRVESFIIDTTSTVATTLFAASSNKMTVGYGSTETMGAVIISREGEQGQHLRSTAAISVPVVVTSDPPYNAESKTAAIESYMASAASSSDWAEESLQD